VVPLLIHCHNRIVAGAGRFLAAQLLGMDVVPVNGSLHLYSAASPLACAGHYRSYRQWSATTTT
jgi:hypothetical protein